MKETTLCYIENDGCYLMMHRTKKKNDENSGKWIGNLNGAIRTGLQALKKAKRPQSAP